MNNHLLLLPKWCLESSIRPAFNDLESLTINEQTFKLYGAMQKLIESYNEWIDKVNLKIKEHQQTEDADDEKFKNEIIQMCNDYIKTMDMKIACQDRQITEIENYLKENLIGSVEIVVNNMKESGELQEVITNTLEEISNSLINYQTEINNKFTELETNLTANINALSNAANEKIANLENYAEELEIIKTDVNNLSENIGDIETNKTDISNLSVRVSDVEQEITGQQKEIDINRSDINNLKNANNRTVLYKDTNSILEDILNKDYSTIVLSDSVENYDAIEVTCVDSEGKKVTLKNDFNKDFDFTPSTFNHAGTTTVIKCARIKVYENKIGISQNYQLSLPIGEGTISRESGKYWAVVQVVGIKY